MTCFLGMKVIFNSLFLIVFLVLSAGCRRQVPYRGPETEQPVVQVYPNYPAGTDLLALIEDYQLGNAEVRYRNSLPEGRISAVYFLAKGNLHVEAQATEDGRNRLLSTPYFEPSDGTIDDRAARWDSALEPSSYPGRKN